MDNLLSSYASPEEHSLISGIIRRHSTNRVDVREAALSGLDLASAREVLDLGCGFGFLSEAVAPRCAGKARLLGVDACPENGPPFLDRIGRTGRRAEFLPLQVDTELPWPEASFDLVVASYSLYFFPSALPEIARILRPGGLFLAITHYRTNMAGILSACRLPPGGTALERLVDCFCAESAAEQLDPHFRKVRCVDYPNSLDFRAEQMEELLRFVAFKLPLILPAARAGDEIPEGLRVNLTEGVAAAGRLVVDKSDAIFHCRGPRCH